MTRRQTRPERDAWEARIAFTKQGFASFTRSLLEIVIMAGIAGGLTQFITDDIRLVLAGAGWAAIAVLFVSLSLAAVILLALLWREPEADSGDGGTVGRIAPNAWITAADGWTWTEQRDYLIDVRDGRARFSQRGAAEYGHEAEAFNALLSRMVLLGLYETHNADRLDNRNGGAWTEEGRDMLNYLDESDD